MVKLMLLRRRHNPPVIQFGHALKVRPDFMVFTGAEATAVRFPDLHHHGRFRNRLAMAKIDPFLLRHVSVQFTGRCLKGAGSRSAIIDATIIESAQRPVRSLEVNPRPGIWVALAPQCFQPEGMLAGNG